MTHATDSAKAGAPLPTSQMRELLGKTTPNWRIDGPAVESVKNPNMGLWSIEGRANVANDMTWSDASFAAAAHNSMPPYLDTMDAQRDRIEALEKALGEIAALDCDPVCCNQPKVVQTGFEEYGQVCCGCPVRNWESGFLRAHDIASKALLSPPPVHGEGEN